MGLTDVFKNIADKEDRLIAEVLAAFINADAFARQQISGRSAINGTDVLRLGRVMSEYGDLAPSAESADAYRKQPAQPSTVRPVVGGGSEARTETAQAA